MKRAVFALAMIATPVAAQPVDGLFHWTGTDPAQACKGLGMSDATIELGEGSIWFIETRCDLTNPVPIRDMRGAVLYDAICSGEGETWTERMAIVPTFEGVGVISPGTVRTYTRCP